MSCSRNRSTSADVAHPSCLAQFVVLLYQYYLYPVDKKRANEFGQVAAPEDAATTTTSTIPDKAEPEKEAAKAKAVKTESRKNR